MATAVCLWHWQQQALEYLREIPEHPVRHQMQRAIKEILRWTPDTRHKWISHEALWDSMRLRQRYPFMGPAHVHAVIVDCNQDAQVFDVYQEWSSDEPSQLLKYWYRATPGTCPARWDNVHQHHNKHISKMLVHYLRRICDRRPIQMEDALAYIQQQAPGTTEEHLELILAGDPGRFAKSFVNGKYMLCANSRHNGVYRSYPSDLDSAMDQRHVNGNVRPHRVPLNVVYEGEPGRQTIYHHWT